MNSKSVYACVLLVSMVAINLKLNILNWMLENHLGFNTKIHVELKCNKKVNNFNILCY